MKHIKLFEQFEDDPFGEDGGGEFEPITARTEAKVGDDIYTDKNVLYGKIKKVIGDGVLTCEYDIVDDKGQKDNISLLMAIIMDYKIKHNS